jgi:geranyl-CoA carboxylase beta subunit
MKIVAEAGAARKGQILDAALVQQQYDRIVETFESQADALVTSGLALDDGIIDPRDTRAVLGECLSMVYEAEHRQTKPLQFAVARM